MYVSQSLHTVFSPAEATSPMSFTTHYIDSLGLDWSLAFMPYDNHWRRVRRLFWQHFHPNVVGQWQASQALESRRFLRCLIDSQADIEYTTKL